MYSVKWSPCSATHQQKTAVCNGPFRTPLAAMGRCYDQKSEPWLNQLFRSGNGCLQGQNPTQGDQGNGENATLLLALYGYGGKVHLR